MSNPNKLYYKTCREQSGLTQEQAIVLLGIADAATLSRYENGHAPVSQDLVAAMVQVYRTPTLAWWYVRHSNPNLSPYLPEPPNLITDGDMMLRLELAADEMATLRCALKTMLRDGCLNCEEVERLKIKSRSFRAMASKFMEVAAYLEERNGKSESDGASPCCDTNEKEVNM